MNFLLSELFIENVAVIKRVSVLFGDKLNVFTGETGAGKSVIINAINAVLGQRTTKDIIRNGEKSAKISAVFTNILPEICEKLSQFGLEIEDDSLIISREINIDGKSIARINSQPVNISVIKEIGSCLINIHGQHDNQALFSPENHIKFLDDFAGNEEIINDYQSTFRQLQNSAKTFKKLRNDEVFKEKRIAELTEIINEISEYKFSENEDEETFEKYQLLKSSAEILESLNKVCEILNGNENEKGITYFCDDAAEELAKNEHLLKDLTKLKERLKNTSIELDDVFTETSNLCKNLDFDDETFAKITKKQEFLNKIKRKYGPTLRDVLNKYEEFMNELQFLQDSENELEKIAENQQLLLKDATKKAEKLSQMRKNAADKFSKAIENELYFLDMPNVKFEIFSEKGKLTLNGMDSVEFLFSVNKGEPPKPISKIASGGELSRIMLAFKSVMAEKDDIPTLIFDEIDTGVSGRAAQKIGVKLDKLAKFRQVFCVTHLAQIAVMADTHLFIEKNNVGNETKTDLRVLEMQERYSEIARIMSGDKITDLTIENAKELINSSKNI